MDSQTTLLDSQTTTRIAPTSHEVIVAMYPTPTQLYKIDTLGKRKRKVWKPQKVLADKQDYKQDDKDDKQNKQPAVYPPLPASDIDEIEDSDIEQDLKMRKRYLSHPKAIEVEIYIKRKSLQLFNL